MQFIFDINGAKRQLNENELTHILEKHFASEVVSIPNKPICGEFFWVSPLLINRQPFYIQREDDLEEMLRQRIAQAFLDLDKALEDNKDNLKEFRAIVPSMQISLNTGEELDIIANDMAGKIANETEQALLWAQRIDNGEYWQEVLSTLYIGGYGKRLLRNDDGILRVYTNLFDEPYTLTEESLTTALPLIITH